MNSIQNLEHSCSNQAETIITKTTCPYCGVGCGVDVTVQHKAQGTTIKVSGDAVHPSNLGRLCIKGSNLADTLGLETRVLNPMFGRKNHRKVTTWDVAIEKIADQFQACIDQYGRDSVAFYVSGQLLTEDYYVVNKLVKGYLGTANIDTNSRLCMSSAVAAHKRAFGEDIVPASYEDFEYTDIVILVGSNTAWCHPVLYQRIMQAKSKNPDLFVVVVDPRFTSTCEQADLHLPILPGQDVALFNGLLQYLYKNDYVDHHFVESYTEGLAALLDASKTEADFNALVKRTGISAEKLQLFFEKFANTEKVMTLFSMGVNQSSQGVNKANSIINCHLLTGKIGKLGAAPFSMTGQPNAMGGREVGGLANMLAAHLDLDNPSHQDLVQGFWNSPVIANQVGLKAVDLFQAVESGKIKAIWIMATNPVVSLPDADQVKRALEKCEFVVVSDICADTDTTAYADVLLPALGWGEKDGTVTNSERRISRQRTFLSAPKQAKADWWAVCEVAKKMGFNGFDFNNACDIFNEHAALSAYQNASVDQRDQVENFRYFNLKGLMNLSVDEYNHLRPIQWPVWEKGQSIAVEQLFDRGGFSHKNKKAKLIPTIAIDPVHSISEDYPLVLNTGRIRDQWHTMTRTGLSANLTTHRAEPFCEIHPNDALKFGIRDKALVEVRSVWGSCVLRVTLAQGVRRGQIFAPIHWTEQVASDARIGKVVNPIVDAISGEPEFKHTPVLIQPFHTTWQGVLYVREGFEQQIKASLQSCAWWTKIKTAKAMRYELADRQSIDQTQKNLKNFLPFVDETYEWLSLEDISSQLSHSIILKDGILIASLYIAPPDLLPDRDWVASLFKRERLSALHRKALLAGMPMSAVSNDGPLVCSCFKVGKNKIIEAIKTQKMTHEKQVTACLKAGGNCGSCLPEIRGLIKTCQLEAEV
ncbi:molybdopterin-dependent oxidoreductase [Acinetobacter sp. VNK23]|uniref:nitrate reductase n=1 Tax=Acinetobacter thutiue TaxID=2998078 RepID=UPI002577CB42|nr:nitrate reductase [Acinetobacter thutiue]MDM1021348.1 molybdopterin-dependent oxidoreductase [Acinetobacter thutiue]